MSNNPNQINNLKNILTTFSNNLLILQKKQTQLTLEFLNSINNNTINTSQNISTINNTDVNNNNNTEVQNYIKDNSEEKEEGIEMKNNNTNINYNNINNEKNDNYHKSQQKKYIKKRTHNEMLENSMSIEEESSNKFKTNLKMKKSEDTEKMIKNKSNEPIHYYYTDPLNNQWCFTETKGS